MNKFNIDALNAALHDDYNFTTHELNLIEYEGFLYWSGTIGNQFKTRCTFLSIKEKHLYLFLNDLKYKLKENELDKITPEQIKYQSRKEIVY
ncbi:hypothetical protein PTW35_25980 (plasmid) [Photobacterium sp. DA100]|uniref:hypothetical protein n=1 Tax=Photobacterium sp. DA100 TaxID=3027472 RepID=UPI002478A427|nr:hypothetical protein [Photobacterium sp. DA100]WEM44705.1 hypothetical protein PTW35_25980 [Photobacterium sp. DA100]